MNKNSISLALAILLAPALASAQSNSNASANTQSNSVSQSQGGTGIGGAGGGGGSASAAGGAGGLGGIGGGASVSGVTAGGAQVGATSTAAGNTQNFSPTTNNYTVTPDVQTVNQNLTGTQTVNQNGTLTTTGHQTTDGTLKTEGTQTNLSLIGGTQGVHYSGSQTIKNVPSMGNINLTSSNDTCHGSASGGIAVPGFGMQVGSTYRDDNCVLLKQARELFNMGLPAAAFALLCTSDPIRGAIKASWRTDQDYLCPADQEGRTQARNAGQNTVAYVPPAPNTVAVGAVAFPVQPAASGSVIAAHGQVTFVKPGWETANLADKAVFSRMMASN